VISWEEQRHLGGEFARVGEGSWPVRRIIGEKGPAGNKQYQVEWEPHPNGEEEFEPHWVSKAGVGKGLVRDWVRFKAQYDAIVVANGHYTIPHIPAITGIAGWHKKYPNIIMHSKAYRRPEDFSGQKVIVVGNSASGSDIAGQLAACAQHPVYLASRSASQQAPTGRGPAWRKDVSEIEAFLLDEGDRAIRTKDGELVDKLDAIIFATGYFYSFPFMTIPPTASVSSSETQSPSKSSSSVDSASSAQHAATTNPSPPDTRASFATNPLETLITSGLRTHNVYKHFLHIDYPTLALPVLNLKVVPFPLAENQAAVIARLWSNRLDLPSEDEMRKWERDEEQRLLDAQRLRPAPNTAAGDSVSASVSASSDEQDQTPNPKYEAGFHTLLYPEDAAQLNTLHKWASSARPAAGLENNGIGKLGTRWDEKQVWLRKRFPDMKAAYTRRGEGRSAITSLEELGGEWRDGFEKWNEETSEEEKADLFRRAAVAGY